LTPDFGAAHFFAAAFLPLALLAPLLVSLTLDFLEQAFFAFFLLFAFAAVAVAPGAALAGAAASAGAAAHGATAASANADATRRRVIAACELDVSRSQGMVEQDDLERPGEKWVIRPEQEVYAPTPRG
jgi:hypothetical protein